MRTCSAAAGVETQPRLTVTYAAGWHRHLKHLAAHLGAEKMDPEDFWTGHDDLVRRYTATAQ